MKTARCTCSEVWCKQYN